jgi:LysM repeat protein
MSTPNPLIPQGTLQNSGSSNVRIAVATVLAMHVVFFGGILLQGCKRDTQTTGDTTTNAVTNALSLPEFDTNSLYYRSASSLPPESNVMATTTATPLQPTNMAPETNVRSATIAQDAFRQSVTTGTQPNGISETVPTKEYTVVRNDNYAKIAKAHGTTVSAIRKANPGVDPAKIRPGMKLNIPAGSTPTGTGTGTTTAAVPDGNVSATAPGTTYTVKAGDNLTKIARAHGVTVSDLRAANGLKTSRVNVNQKLKIPAPAAKASAATTSTNPTF